MVAQRPVRILRAVNWPVRIEKKFFLQKTRVLPRYEYPPLRFDAGDLIRRFRDIRAKLSKKVPIERILSDSCAKYITTIRMLAARGTPDFYKYSRELYGHAGSLYYDGKSTNLQLAHHFNTTLDPFQLENSTEEAPRLFGDREVARRLRARFASYFLDHDVRVAVSHSLTANAAAGAQEIKIRKGRLYTEAEVGQLEHHEGYVHVGTSINGSSQPVLKILGKGSPRTTRYQEGLATFAELISQTMDPKRFRRLADRVISIDMAQNGADFIELFRYYLERGYTERDAYQGAVRCVRGGLVTGGAPFTKDVAYLDGLVRIYNFIRIALARKRPEFVRFLFVGKIIPEDIPALLELHREGLVQQPRYLPPWAANMDFLTSFMSFSVFLDSMDIRTIEKRYDALMG